MIDEDEDRRRGGADAGDTGEMLAVATLMSPRPDRARQARVEAMVLARTRRRRVRLTDRLPGTGVGPFGLAGAALACVAIGYFGADGLTRDDAVLEYARIALFADDGLSGLGLLAASEERR